MPCRCINGSLGLGAAGLGQGQSVLRTRAAQRPGRTTRTQPPEASPVLWRSSPALELAGGAAAGCVGRPGCGVTAWPFLPAVMPWRSVPRTGCTGSVSCGGGCVSPGCCTPNPHRVAWCPCTMCDLDHFAWCPHRVRGDRGVDGGRAARPVRSSAGLRLWWGPRVGFWALVATGRRAGGLRGRAGSGLRRMRGLGRRRRPRGAAFRRVGPIGAEQR